MRISVSGTTCIGKSTFVQDFCKHWTNYTSPRYSYRDELVKLPHSKTCTKDTQWLILNSMIDELQKHSAQDHVIFDRCPLDNLVYSMWAFDKGEGDLDASGDVIGAEGDSILNPENLDELEALLKQQQTASESEAFEKKQVQMLKEFVAATKRK